MKALFVDPKPLNKFEPTAVQSFKDIVNSFLINYIMTSTPAGSRCTSSISSDGCQNVTKNVCLAFQSGFFLANLGDLADEHGNYLIRTIRPQWRIPGCAGH